MRVSRVSMRPSQRSMIALLTSRRAVLSVSALAVAYGLVIALVPQQPQAGASAVDAISTLGLDHVVTTWSFRALVCVALLQIVCATLRITRRDIRRLVRPRGPAGERFEVVDAGALSREVKRRGYVRVRRSPAASRFVKHPWGLLGATILHAGLLLAGLGVVIVTLTRSVGLLTLVEGQTLPKGSALADPSHGPLGPAAVVPKTITLERVIARFWDTGEPRRYTGVYVIGDGPKAARLEITTNSPRTFEETRYHQEGRVGYAFFVTLSQPHDAQKIRLDLPQPQSPTEPSYVERALPDASVLKARCDVDEPAGSQPRLTLRLLRQGRQIGEASLTEGDAAKIGAWSVSLDGVRRWAVLTIDQSRGYGLLFSSFFVVFAGGVLLYVSVPRELTVYRREDGSVWADWYVPRFHELYRSELDSLRGAAEGGRR